MSALAHDQMKAHGRARVRPICGGMGRRAPAFDHLKFKPARSTSLARQLGLGAAHHRARLGHFFADTSEPLEFVAMVRAGLNAQVALANLNPQLGNYVCQDHADAAEVTHVVLSQVAAFDDLEPSDGENGRVPNQPGKLPNQRGELPNVGNR